MTGVPVMLNLKGLNKCFFLGGENRTRATFDAFLLLSMLSDLYNYLDP